ncbi:MAG: cyclic nucleotide-binding domain-containing protein [Acidobacteria bacterium]|nr:cyclic nucleotide-binding domain-containing protein [Acidobacteriota bacterium]
MPLAWLRGDKDLSVEELIARKKYSRAVEVLREQFRLGSRDPRMRHQLAEVLVMAGKGREAIPILIGLADEYALEGFAAKAIAVLKKIEKIEPGRADVEKKLASLIHQEKGRGTTGAFTPTGTFIVPGAPASGPLPEIGMEAPAAAPPPQAPETPAAPEEGAEVEPMSEEAFGLELVEVAHEAAEPPPSTGGGPRPAVASPLFSDFSEEELLEVMHGMRLLDFGPGDIIITEGEPGDSLFVLTTGVVKAFIRNPAGRHVQVREMGEGSFFGEISVLTGGPRTATVTAASRCELLELDKPTLDRIATSHPHVRAVLQEFYEQRQGSKDEALIRQMTFGGSNS